MIDTAVHVSNVAYEPLVFDCTKTTTDNLARLLLSKWLKFFWVDISNPLTGE